MEKAAYLGREHMTDYLNMKPRPKHLPHLIAGHGSIADRFMEVFAWPQTVRKFPIRDPAVGPEATCYCSESLAKELSLDWLFNEYFLRESAFRAPIISSYPTHCAVGIVRIGNAGKICAATVFVQLNSTRVRSEMEEEWVEAGRLEAKEADPVQRAEFLRRLGRLGDPRSLPHYKTRLRSKDTEVVSAALDAYFLNDPEQAEKWIAKQVPRLVRAHREDRFKAVIPLLRTMAGVRYDLKTRLRGRKELEALESLASRVLTSALEMLQIGDEDFAEETLRLVVQRFDGLAAAEAAALKLEELKK
jgi:hypothetical protein